MKILRYVEREHERLGLCDTAQVMRALTVRADWTPPELAPERLARVAALDPGRLPAEPAGTRLGAALEFIASGTCAGVGVRSPVYLRARDRVRRGCGPVEWTVARRVRR